MTDKVSDAEINEWIDSDNEVTPTTVDLDDQSIDNKYSASQLRIVRTTMDFTLHTLRQQLNDPNYLKLNPKYQRRLRWTRKQRSLLIESFLMNIPIPPIFLFENNYNQYEVMDGRQRLEAIKEFLANNYALSGLEFWPELNQKRFNELPKIIQNGLLRRTISAVTLLAESSQPSETGIDVRMVLFNRLNTGGTKLNPQEIRNAIYPGLFNEMVHDLGREEPFTTIWGIPQKSDDEENDPPPELMNNTLYRNMADCELVLRFFAIRETILKGIGGSLRNLLNRCMEGHKDDDAKAIEENKKLFRACITKLFEIFGNFTFVLDESGKLSRPLYDALMVALSLHIAEIGTLNSAAIKDRMESTLRDKASYEIIVGRGNTVEAIRNRVVLAEKILGC